MCHFTSLHEVSKLPTYCIALVAGEVVVFILVSVVGFEDVGFAFRGGGEVDDGVERFGLWSDGFHGLWIDFDMFSCAVEVVSLKGRCFSFFEFCLVLGACVVFLVRRGEASVSQNMVWCGELRRCGKGSRTIVLMSLPFSSRRRASMSKTLSDPSGDSTIG